FLYCAATLLALHSFPTRRSSDLFSSRTSLEASKNGGPYGQNEGLKSNHDETSGRGIIFGVHSARRACALTVQASAQPRRACPRLDRKSTRLNSSHVAISYAVFCL